MKLVQKHLTGNKVMIWNPQYELLIQLASQLMSLNQFLSFLEQLKLMYEPNMIGTFDHDPNMVTEQNGVKRRTLEGSGEGYPTLEFWEGYYGQNGTFGSRYYPEGQGEGKPSLTHNQREYDSLRTEYNRKPKKQLKTTKK